MILTFLLIYPIFFFLRWIGLGARYDVVRAAYPLVRYVPIEGVTGDLNRQQVCQVTGKPASADIRQIQGEWFELAGVTEQQWLALWQRVIAVAAVTRRRGHLRQAT